MKIAGCGAGAAALGRILGCAEPSSPARAAAKRPNILLFLPDQHRGDWLGANPALPLRTPNLDRLAGGGARFTRAYCPSPLCAPSRASLAAGRSYDRCGVAGNHVNYPLEQPTFYRSLRDAGYRVGGVGKFDLHKATRDWGADGSRLLKEWGFTDGIDNEGKFDGSSSYLRNGRPMGPYLKFLAGQGLADDYVAEHAVERRRAARGAYTTVLSDHAYCDNWIGENAKRVLRSLPAGVPWFLQVNFTGPHNPMDVTASMESRWRGVEFPPPHANDQKRYSPEDHQRNRRNYAAMIENIDRLCGEILGVVDERGELGGTLVAYSSDHGEMLGDHGKWGKGTWREPSVHVPLAVAGPEVKAGVVSDALVSLHDLAPTFLECADAAGPDGMDARSLWPLLGGRTARRRESLVTGLGKWRAVVADRLKLVSESDGGTMLFDLEADPTEDRNIADGRPREAEELLAVLDRECPGWRKAIETRG